MACERPPFLDGCALSGLRGLRPPSAPQRRLRDILFMSRPPLLREEGSVLPENFVKKNKKLWPCYLKGTRKAEKTLLCLLCLLWPSPTTPNGNLRVFAISFRF